MDFESLQVVLESVIGPRVLQMRERGELGTKAKGGQHWDIVTEADKFAEETLTEWVKVNHPTHGVEGEEGARIVGTSGYVWYFDPIDGTINFERGSDFWGVSCGLLHNGVPLYGMVYYPALRKTFSATPAVEGAQCVTKEGLHWYDMQVSSMDNWWMRPPAPTLKQALVVANCWVGFESVFFAIRQNCKNAVMFGSMVYDVLTLVEGKVDAVFHMGATPYDIAAITAIARAAGCTVSGIMTDELDFSQKKIPVIFARSESLRDQLRMVIKEAMLDAAVK